MIKVEAETLEEAYKEASLKIGCSVTELSIEIIQNPSPGIFGFFKKKAIIVATLSGILQDEIIAKKTRFKKVRREAPVERVKEEEYSQNRKKVSKTRASKGHETKKHYFEKDEELKREQRVSHKRGLKKSHELNSTIIPQSFVNDQEEDDVYEDIESGTAYTADYDDAYDDNTKLSSMEEIALNIDEELNELFDLICFDIDNIVVSVYDEETIKIDFKGEDAALLIGKEGYRYKALSYMLFNWVNSKYDVQLRLEIAEFLKNQEEAVDRYLENVYETIDRDGRAQTKILDGVLVQIALEKLRHAYPEKYVVIRSTRDGLKYIIVNDYHNS